VDLNLFCLAKKREVEVELEKCGVELEHMLI
jgi:hypothetical protein